LCAYKLPEFVFCRLLVRAALWPSLLYKVRRVSAG
jgi:hypothetical protein